MRVRSGRSLPRTPAKGLLASTALWLTVGWHAQARRVRRADRGSDDATKAGASGRVRRAPACFSSAWRRFAWPCHPKNRLRRTTSTALCLTAAWCGGCGSVVSPSPAPLFTAPLLVDGASVGDAVIDTGGDYEVILRDRSGLSLVDTAEVLVFGGRETVAVTEPFRYSVGGIEAAAEFALVGLSVCDCNGVGFHFFRKTGTVLGLDFPAGRADFLTAVPDGGVTLAFDPPPPELPGFDSAFIEVDVTPRGYDVALRVLALLDTGTNATVMRRGLFAAAPSAMSDRVDIRIGRAELGTVAAQVGLFDTPGLPDLIIGTDIMRAWSDRWYFNFAQRGGTVTAHPRIEEPTLSTLSERVPAARREGAQSERGAGATRPIRTPSASAGSP